MIKRMCASNVSTGKSLKRSAGISGNRRKSAVKESIYDSIFYFFFEVIQRNKFC